MSKIDPQLSHKCANIPLNPSSQVGEDAMEDELEEEHGGPLARLVEVVERSVGGFVDDGDGAAAVTGTLHYARSSAGGAAQI